MLSTTNVLLVRHGYNTQPLWRSQVSALSYAVLTLIALLELDIDVNRVDVGPLLSADPTPSPCLGTTGNIESPYKLALR
jgi:hypothetical protein